ncbi:MAG: hypothetical protein NZ580_07750 [Bacteroidia bacterium]|nr:hypothetical protein [Bacteroidia bacterium]MDW8235553.1 hypothetical protein [Bacteroidia bacterium]
MKPTQRLTTLLGLTLYSLLSAQSFRRDTDTIVMNPGYRYQVYYQLSSERQDTALRCGWHLAFEVPIRGAAIRANHPCGVSIYKTTRDTSGWTQLTLNDTVHPLYDNLCRWDIGAFNTTKGSSAFDVGWGLYSINDHITRGDSLYIIRIGNAFKKLWIQRLQGTEYFIRVAELDGSRDTTYAVRKTLAPERNFVYLNLLTHRVFSVEPPAQEWDLVFTQYTKPLPLPDNPTTLIPYNLVGVLMNNGVRATRIRLPRNGNPDTLRPTHYALDSCISLIGDDWKFFDRNTGQWTLADTLYFLIRDKRGNLWRMRFIGFEGSTTGRAVVEKTLLQRAGGTSLPTAFVQDIRVYPQPAEEGVFIEFPQPFSGKVELFTLRGEKLFSLTVQNQEQIYIPRPSGGTRGAYWLHLHTSSGVWGKLVIFN